MNIIKPDIAFITEINKDTGFSLKSCMQCGTCSVVCGLSPDNNPFPRKEMLLASWGQKEKLMGDPDIWLCHQCGDCTTNCPRGVKPGDVLASIRKIAYYHYSYPNFLAGILNKPVFLPLVLSIPVIFLLFVLFLAGTLNVAEGVVNYSKFLPHSYLNISFTVLLALIISGIIFSVRSFWRAMKSNSHLNKRTKSLLKTSLSVIREILIHENFKKCTAERFKYPAHFLVFWGFLLLILTTVLAIINVLFFEYPLSFLHPVKILGNISGVIFLTGCLIMLLERIKNSNTKTIYSYPDWLFLITLLLVTVSGFLTEIARLGNWTTAYHIYFVHLVVIFILIIYLPYTKFSHVVYRTVASIYAGYYGR